MLRDKHSKFVKLAEQRTNTAIKSIQLIGNLSNKQNYAYSEEQAAKIIAVLEGELKELKLKFKAASKIPTQFKLSDD